MEKENAKGDELVGRKIMYRWEGFGWCVGEIVLRNVDATLQLDKQPVNFYVFYEIDKQVAKHALSLKNYRKEGARGDTDYHHWVLLEEVKE